MEPDQQNMDFISRNIDGDPNAKLVCAALHDHDGSLDMNIVDNPVEHSLLQPDSGNPMGVRTVPVFTVDSLIDIVAIGKIDFAKIEAEGVELEIINGIRSSNIPKIVVDCSPARNGESPMQEIRDILEMRGYKVVTRGWMLFAKIL